MTSIVAAMAEIDAADRAFLAALGREVEVVRLHPEQTRAFTLEEARRVGGVYLGSGWHVEAPTWLRLLRPKWICGRDWTAERVEQVGRLSDAPLFALDVDAPWDLLDDEATRVPLDEWLGRRLGSWPPRPTGGHRFPPQPSAQPSAPPAVDMPRVAMPDVAMPHAAMPADDSQARTGAFGVVPSPATGAHDLQTRDPVRLDASAPAVARAGEPFLARFVACAPADWAEVAPYLERPDGRAPHELMPSPTRWRRGARVTVTCHGQGLVCQEPTRVQRWSGEPLFLDFEVTARQRYGAPPAESVRLGFDVAVEGVVLNKLRLKIGLRGDPGSERVGATARAPTTAFASHARLDQPRVADCCTALERHAGLDIFVDCLDLRPGDKWWRRLVDEIDGRELFLLFWSDHAAASPNVEREWRHAFARKAREAIEVHPLAPWPKLSVPPEFADVHVASRYQVLRAAGLDDA